MKMPQQVAISRILLPTPTIDDPERKVYQIQYTAGELPPHFIYMPEKEWSKDKELKAIKQDIEKRLGKVGEVITI
jgi:hypothetical protein